MIINDGIPDREGHSLFAFEHPDVPSFSRRPAQPSSVVRVEKDDVGLPQVPRRDT